MLVNWGFNFQESTSVLAWLNLGQLGMDGTSYSATAQMLVVLALLIIFISLGILLEKRTNTAFSLMFRRKNVIFPFRIFTFFFNFLTASCLLQLMYLSYQVETSAVNFVLAFITLIFLIVGMLLIFFKLNFSRAELDDPRYYALIEKQVSNQKRVKNIIVFSLLTRMIILAAFIGGFNNPLAATIVMSSIQGIYLIYYAIFIRNTKIRFLIVNLVSNVQLLIGLVCAGQFARNQSDALTVKIVWLLNLVVFVVIMVTVYLTEIVATWMPIKRHLRSVFVRFILCRKEEEELTLNKYDRDYNKEKVTEFQENPLHSKIRPLTIDDGL